VVGDQISDENVTTVPKNRVIVPGIFLDLCVAQWIMNKIGTLNVIIERKINNTIVHQKSSDGYVNCNQLCNAINISWDSYYTSADAKKYLENHFMVLHGNRIAYLRNQ
jgi:hypothetical protein